MMGGNVSGRLVTRKGSGGRAVDGEKEAHSRSSWILPGV